MQTTLILLNDGRNILVSNEQPKGGDYVLREDYSVNIWTKGISMGYLHTHPSKLPKVIIAGIEPLPTLTYADEVKQELRDKYGWITPIDLSKHCFVPLSQDKTAIVDKEDFEKVNKYKWSASKYYDNLYYASTNILINGEYKKESLHRFILNLNNKDLVIDHINHNGLDNRKENLRICSKSENNLNRIKPKNMTSKYKGVSITKIKKKNKIFTYYRAEIVHEGKRFYLSSYPFTPEGEIQAAKKYNEKAIELHGQFAYLNTFQDSLQQPIQLKVECQMEEIDDNGSIDCGDVEDWYYVSKQPKITNNSILITKILN